MHPLLLRQLRRMGIGESTPPTAATWEAFLTRMDQVLRQADEDRRMLERSLSISSEEMQELYETLKQSTDAALASERDKLSKAGASLQAVLASAEDGVLVIDDQRRLEAFNTQFVKLWRLPPELVQLGRCEAMVGRMAASVRDPEAWIARVKDYASDPLLSGTDEFELADGRTVSRFTAPVWRAPGAVFGRVWFYRDISEPKRMVEELRGAKETAETAARAKADFLANMSHELRTPLNSIVGFSRLLERSTNLGEKERGQARHVVTAAEHMLSLVNDLLDLRRAEERPLELGPVELEPVVETALDFVRLQARDKELQLLATVPRKRVTGEATALLQVLVNLLSNAVKFTPRGHVKVEARATDGEVEICVSDSGIGIAAEDQPKLFQYYAQVGEKQARGLKGSGLGLALARTLAESMRGTITVESELGVGSRFTLRLPAWPAPVTDVQT